MAEQERIPLRGFVWSGLAFGTCMGLLMLWLTGQVGTAIEGALFSGGLLGFILYRFVKKSMSTTQLEVDGQAAQFEHNESLLHHGPANHFKGMEAVGGKLFLTTQRLRFRSHKMNVQNHDSSYPLADVRAVEPSRTLGIIPNGLLVTLKNGTHQRFVVHGRARWLLLIRQQCGAHGSLEVQR